MVTIRVLAHLTLIVVVVVCGVVVGSATAAASPLREARSPVAGQPAAAPTVAWDVWRDLPLGAKDRQHVLDLAREVGVTPARVSTTMDSAPMGCPVLLVESARGRRGQQRTWTSVLIGGRTPKAWRRDCEPKRRNPANPHHPWGVVRGPLALSDWVFEDGAWQHALALRDVPYEEAVPLVLAFHRNEVNVDRAAGRRVPIGEDASRITHITPGRTGRWAVHIEYMYGDTIYELDLRDGRYVIVDAVEIVV